MALTDSKVLLFNDGEAADYVDFNDVVKGASQRAWEWPGYADALPHALASSVAYETMFSGASEVDKMVYCKGPGASMTISGLNYRIGQGFLGMFAGTASPVVLDPKMRWIYVSSAHSIAMTAAPAGQKRFDVVTIDIAESASDSEPRNFKDATTGALSTTTPSKRTKLAGTLTVTQGVAAGSPEPPAAPSAHIVALVLVNETAVEKIYDCTMPFGLGHTSIGLTHTPSVTTNWGAQAGGALLAGAAGAVAHLFPPEFAGDPSARLLGVEIGYTLSSGFAVEVIDFESAAALSVNALRAITGDFTAGAGLRQRVDLRGYPHRVAAATCHTFWGTGAPAKSALNSGSGKTVALRITSGATNDRIEWIKWLFAKG